MIFDASRQLVSVECIIVYVMTTGQTATHITVLYAIFYCRFTWVDQWSSRKDLQRSRVSKLWLTLMFTPFGSLYDSDFPWIWGC